MESKPCTIYAICDEAAVASNLLSVSSVFNNVALGQYLTVIKLRLGQVKKRYSMGWGRHGHADAR